MPNISEFSSSSEICAVSFGKNDPFYHCGMLYKFENNSYFLHLGDPFHLHHDSEAVYLHRSPSFIWKPFNGIPEAMLNLIKTKCKIISDKYKSLDYGIFHDETTYFDDSGELHLGDNATGLTCATFVKTLLKGVGIDIIDDTDWPDERDTDLSWLDKMTAEFNKSIENYLDKNKKLFEELKVETNQYIKKQKEDDRKFNHTRVDVLKSCIKEFAKGKKVCFTRFRPEEVSASSYEPLASMAIKYEYPNGRKGAKELGEQLIIELT